jgi:hypothetical protein
MRVHAAMLRDVHEPFGTASLDLESPRRDEALVQLVATGSAIPISPYGSRFATCRFPPIATLRLVTDWSQIPHNGTSQSGWSWDPSGPNLACDQRFRGCADTADHRACRSSSPPVRTTKVRVGGLRIARLGRIGHGRSIRSATVDAASACPAVLGRPWDALWP